MKCYKNMEEEIELKKLDCKIVSTGEKLLVLCDSIQSVNTEEEALRLIEKYKKKGINANTRKISVEGAKPVFVVEARVYSEDMKRLLQEFDLDGIKKIPRDAEMIGQLVDKDHEKTVIVYENLESGGYRTEYQKIPTYYVQLIDLRDPRSLNIERTTSKKKIQETIRLLKEFGSYEERKVV